MPPFVATSDELDRARAARRSLGSPRRPARRSPRFLRHHVNDPDAVSDQEVAAQEDTAAAPPVDSTPADAEQGDEDATDVPTESSGVDVSAGSSTSARRSARIRDRPPSFRELMAVIDAADAAERDSRRRTRAQVTRERAQTAAKRHVNVQGADGEEPDEDDDDEQASDPDHDKGGDATEEDYDDEQGDEQDSDEDDETGPSPGRKRKAKTGPVYVPSDKDVRVAPPDLFYADWDVWAVSHKNYCESTMQILPVAETISVKQKNDRIRKTVGIKRGETTLIVVPLDPYQRTIICTHGWKRRKRGKGERPRKHLRSTGCPFRFVVQACPIDESDPSGSPWHLQTKFGFFLHNHPITPDSNVASVDDNDATALELAKFAKEDPDNVVTVDETVKLESGVISITTKMMRVLCGRFREMLFIDCTHKTNRYNYQLLTIMIITELGEGMPVQQSLIEANGDWHMDRAIQHFKRANADNWKLLRVIMVHKDLNEIRVLQRHFPEARILICYFHVRKYLKEMSGKFGVISADDKKNIDMIVGNMIRARDDATYEDNRATLRARCHDLDLDGFFDYMERNWHTCQDMWVLGRRGNLPYFRNDTNNVLESFFGRFKDGVKSDYSMSECVQALIASARIKENEYRYLRDRIGHNFNDGYDEEMGTLLRFTTHFVAGNVEAEYSAAIANADEYEYELLEAVDVVLVRGPKNVSAVSTLDWSCNCDFAMSMLLPCRHAMAYRRASGLGTVIPLKRVDERWTSAAAALKETSQFEYHAFTEEDARASKRQRAGLSREERYREALRATHLIANEPADIDDSDEFSEMLTFLETQWRNVRQRRRTGTIQNPTAAVEEVDASPHVAEVRGVEGHYNRLPMTDHVQPMTAQTKSMTDLSPDVNATITHADSDEEMEQTQIADPAAVELSQPHSLWSEDVGDVHIVNPTEVRFGKLASLHNQSQHELAASGEGVHTRLKVEAVVANKSTHAGELSDSSSDELSDDYESSLVRLNPKAPRINLNTKARRGGRRKTDIKQRKHDEAVEFVRFNHAEKSRRELEAELVGVPSSLVCAFVCAIVRVRANS